jgi:hypothetical protein
MMDAETRKRFKDMATVVLMLERHTSQLRRKDDDFRITDEELTAYNNVLQIPKPAEFQQFVEDEEPAPVRQPVAVIRGVEYFEGDVLMHQDYTGLATLKGKSSDTTLLVERHDRHPFEDLWTIKRIALYSRAGSDEGQGGA